MQWVNVKDIYDCVWYNTGVPTAFPVPYVCAKYDTQGPIAMTLKSEYAPYFFPDTRVRFSIDSMHETSELDVRFGTMGLYGVSPHYYIHDLVTIATLSVQSPVMYLSHQYNYGSPSEDILLTVEIELDVVTQFWRDYIGCRESSSG